MSYRRVPSMLGLDIAAKAPVIRTSPVISARPAVMAAPAFAPSPTDPGVFIEPGCVDYRYDESHGMIPATVPAGSVLVTVMLQVTKSKAEVDGILAGWHRLQPFFVAPTAPATFTDNAEFVASGSAVIEGDAYGGTAIWIAVRTRRTLDARAVLVTRYLVSTLNALSRPSATGTPAIFPVRIVGAAIPSVMAASANTLDIQLAVLNAFGLVTQFGAAFNILFTAVRLPATAARPLATFTGPAAALASGVQWLSNGPAAAAAAVAACRGAVATANAQIASVPDPDIAGIVSTATTVLTEQRRQLSSGISALQGAMAAEMPPTSGLDSAIASMRAAVQSALESANTQLRSASTNLRRYAQCQAQKAAEPAARTAIANARQSIDYFAANQGAKAAMPAMVAQLQDALAQIDAIERDLNVSGLQRHLWGLPVWGWLAIGVGTLLAGAVTIRVVRSRRARRAATPVKANRWRRSLPAYV